MYIKIFSTKKQWFSKKLQFRILRNEKGRLELALIIDEKTSIGDLEKDWNQIKSITNEIFNQQGTDLDNYINITRLGYANMYFQEGFSYTEVAMDANFDMLCNLIDINEYQLKDGKDSANELLAFVIMRMQAVGIKDNDIKPWIEQGLDSVKEGLAPWDLISGPFSQRRIIDLIKQLRKDFKHKRLVLKPNQQPKQKMVSVSDLYEKNNFSIDKARELLIKMPKAGRLLKLENAHLRYLNYKKGVEKVG